MAAVFVLSYVSGIRSRVSLLLAPALSAQFTDVQLSPQEQTRIRNVCKNFSTTLRNSQSGNDLLRSL